MANVVQVIVKATDQATPNLLKAKATVLALQTAVVGAIGASIKAAIDFESSFAGVRKTVDASEAEFAALAQGFRNMAKEIPVAVNDLNRIGEAAGQLGIKKENILGFTRVVADLGVATNLTAEDAGNAMARIANITGLAQDEFDRLGSAIVALGNTSATTESEIVEFGLRIAGAGEIAGLTEAQILGIGAAMSSVGVEAEAGGTAAQKVLLGITEAVNTGSEKLEVFAATAGLSAEEFAKAWQTDAGDAFRLFVEGLGAQGQAAFQTLDKLDLTDQRLIRSFLSLSGAGDLLARSMQTATDAFAENNALAEEAEKRYATTASQIQILRNQLTDLGITIGSEILPVLNEFIATAIALGDEIRENWGTIAEVAKFAFGDIATGVEVIEDLISGIASLLRGDWMQAWQEFANAAIAAVEGLVNFHVDAFNLLIQAYNNTIAKLPGVAEVAEIATLHIQRLGEAAASSGEALSAATSQQAAWIQSTMAAADTTAAFTGALEQSEEEMKAAEEAAKKFGDSLSEAIANVLPEVTQSFDEWIEELDRLIAAYEEMPGNLSAIYDVLVALGVDNAAAMIGVLQQQGPEYVALFTRLFAQDPAAAVERLAALMPFLTAQAVAAAGEGLMADPGAIAAATEAGIVAPAIGAVSQLPAAFGAAGAAAGAAFFGGLSGQRGKSGTGANMSPAAAAIARLNDVLAGSSFDFSPSGGGGGGGGSSAVDEAIDVVRTFMDALTAEAQSSKWLDEMGKAGAALAEALTSAMEDPTEHALGRLAGSLQEFVDEAGVTGTELIAKIKAALDKGDATLVPAITDLIRTMAREGGLVADEAATSLIDTFTGAMAEAATDRYYEARIGDIGVRLIHALQEGFEENSPAAIEKAAGIADQIVETINDTFGAADSAGIVGAFLSTIRAVIESEGGAAVDQLLAILAKIQAAVADGTAAGGAIPGIGGTYTPLPGETIDDFNRRIGNTSGSGRELLGTVVIAGRSVPIYRSNVSGLLELENTSPFTAADSFTNTGERIVGGNLQNWGFQPVNITIEGPGMATLASELRVNGERVFA